MNKRIREIAHEATVWCENNAKGTPIAWEWEEKFGELIIKECVDLFEDDSMEPMRVMYSNMLTRDIIRKHFGIKE